MGFQVHLSVVVLEAVLLMLSPIAHATPHESSETSLQGAAPQMLLEGTTRRQLQQAPQRISIVSGPTENETVSQNDFPVIFEVPGNANTECLLSRGPITVRDWFQCSSPLTLPEVREMEGRYTLRIRLVSADPTIAAQSEAVVSFYMDLTEPDTEILSASSDKDDSTNYWFEFDGIGDDVDFFECELDFSGYWERCQSPKIYRGLVYGEHIFAVRAVDLAGNADSTPATALFEIENPFQSPSPVMPEAAPPSEISTSSSPNSLPEVSSLVAPLPQSDSVPPTSLPSPSFVDLTKDDSASSSLSPALPSSPSPSSTSIREQESDATAAASLVGEESPEVVHKENASEEEEEDPSLDFGGGKKNQMQGTVVVKEFTPDTMSVVIMALATGLIAVATMGIVIFYCSRGSRLCLRGGYSLI